MGLFSEHMGMHCENAPEGLFLEYIKQFSESVRGVHSQNASGSNENTSGIYLQNAMGSILRMCQVCSGNASREFSECVSEVHSANVLGVCSVNAWELFSGNVK